MKKIIVIQNIAILFFIATKVFSATQKDILMSTHIYNEIAIQSYDNKIIISKAQLKNTIIQKNNFKIPEIGDPIWTITIKDLQVSKTTCLDIDATLCSTYTKMNLAGKNSCYSNCITTYPEFITYDEKNHLLYIDAGSDVSGTAGDPQFLFVADIEKKQITYLNTFMSPYTAYLSSQGSYLAIERGYNEIVICNTHTGEKFEIREDDYDFKNNASHSLSKIHWLNDSKFQYDDILYNNRHQEIKHGAKEKIFDIKSKKVIYIKTLG